MADVTMPQLGETVTEGTITRWMKSVGDQVTRDEPLFEVSTDKVDSEVPAPATGVLSEILVPEGETVEVGARLAVIGDGGAAPVAPSAPEAEAPATAAPAPQAPTPPPATAAPAEAPAPTAADVATPITAPTQDQQFAPETPPPGGPATPPPAGAPGAPPAQPAAAPPPPPATDGSPPPPPAGYVPAQGAAGAPSAGVAAPGAAAQPSGPEALLLSPVVRRLLDENGIAASEIAGTGVGGRITREDVLREIDARRAAGGAAATPEAPAPVPEAPAQPAAAQPTAAPPQPTAQPTAPPAQAVQAPATAPATAAAQAAPTPAAPPQAPPAPAAPQAPPPQAGPAPAAVPQAPAAPQAAPLAPSAPATQPPRPPAPAAQTALMRYGDRVVPFSNMRRRTAEHMVRSKATSPHAYIAYEVDFENVDRVRRAWSERFKAEEGFSLTYLPFVARAAVDALREYPQLNASVVDDSLVVHQQVNLGIAVDLNHEGLIVPVVHRAEEITLRGIARRVRDLADRARSRQLTADDIAGGTFSITNDGPFGTYFTVPIINQPQVAILATDGVRRRPVVVTLPDGSESLAIHSVGVLGMSWDHRAVDGAYVSAFLRRLAEVINTRDWVAEL